MKEEASSPLPLPGQTMESSIDKIACLFTLASFSLYFWGFWRRTCMSKSPKWPKTIATSKIKFDSEITKDYACMGFSYYRIYIPAVLFIILSFRLTLQALASMS